MSQALDDLTTATTALEAAVSTVQTEFAALVAGSDTTALPAVTARITAATATLNGLQPPAA